MCDSCEKQGLITSVITPNNVSNKPSAMILVNSPNSLIPQQANNDGEVIQLWLHGRGNIGSFAIFMRRSFRF
jgi:hypothetical protein